MKAVVFERYGGPEAMAVRDLPVPEIGPDDVLVEVHAASVNPLDWKLREGMMRQVFDLPMPYVPGRDFSGVVHRAGSNVTAPAPGEEVYGTAERLRQGAQAELLPVAAGLVARKPAGLSHVEAASFPVTALTAICALEETAPVQRGDRILIHGGAGGVGGFAIQLAAHRGAVVTATASAANADHVKALGAEAALDYRSEDFTALPAAFDIVLDTIGGTVHARSFQVLRPGGTLVYVSAAPIEGPPPRKDVSVRAAAVRYESGLLDRVSALIESGVVKPRVEAVYPLGEAVAAYNRNQAGHARGKIVLELR